MGCDIHFYVERLIEDQWILVYPEPYDEYDPDYSDRDFKELAKSRRYIAVDGADWNWNQRLQHPLYFGRNYALFSMLADVRNYSGVQPLDEPRGVPDDASPAYVQESEGDDWHSHSWFTVEELLNYPWHDPPSRGDYITIAAFRNLTPASIDPDLLEDEERLILDEVQMRELAVSAIPSSDQFYVFKSSTRHEYSLADEVSTFREKTLPALKAIDDPDKVRVCFFFDN